MDTIPVDYRLDLGEARYYEKALPPELVPSAWGSPQSLGTGVVSIDRSSVIAKFKRWTRVAIDARSDAVGRQRMRVGRLNNNHEIEGESPDHPIQKELDAPNWKTTHFAAWKLIEIYMELVGDAYLWRKGPNDTWVIPSQWVWPWYRKGELYKYRIYPIYGHPQELDPNGVIEFQNPNPMFPLDGMSAVWGSDLWIDSSEQMDWSRFASFRESIIPSILLEMTDGPYKQAPPSRDDVERIQAKLRARFQGPDKVGEPVIIPPGFKATVVDNDRDLRYKAGAEQLRDQCLATHRTPKTAVGLTDVTNRATWEAARIAFHNDTIGPRLIYYAEEMTRYFRFLTGDDRLVLYYPDSEQPTDSDLKRQEWEQHARLGAVFVNEYRKAFKLEPLAQDYLMGEKPTVEGRAIEEGKPLPEFSRNGRSQTIGANHE